MLLLKNRHPLVGQKIMQGNCKPPLFAENKDRNKERWGNIEVLKRTGFTGRKKTGEGAL